MTSPRIGSLFSGYGGLDCGVMAALGGSVAWHVEYDKAPSKILAHHWPDVPNYGDVTAVDWSAVEPVDIITGGSPCQDLSHAGKRQGMTEGTRSNLWVAMREAIALLRPGLVVWENVRGAYSAAADSDLEFCPGCMGDPWDRGPVLRALGRVLGDLSDLGYDCRWHGLRAADVGAPHGRFRVFVVAEDAQRPGRGAAWHAASSEAIGGRTSAIASGSGGVGTDEPLRSVVCSRQYDHDAHRWISRDFGGPVWCPGRGESVDGPTLPLTPEQEWRAANSPTPEWGWDALPGDERAAWGDVTLLPTPAVNDMGEGKTPEAWDEWTAKMQAAHGNGNGHGKSLAIEAQRLLPTPSAIDGNGGPKRIRDDGRTEADHGPALRDLASSDRWGIYADAIARWEALTGPAPAPTQPSKKGTPQLSPAFSEWLMGLPEGHVTGVPGLSRNDQLKALGNGVVWQQAAAALRFLLATEAAA